jgi:hypothetical protein
VTAGELIAALAELPADTLIIMSADGEGNNFSPLADVDTSHSYLAETTWRGEIGLRALTDEQRARGFSEEDLAPEGAVACVVLWPVN